ncbi:MAG: mechanosensitive ion channel family protein, partial [Bacteroidaceae bacterium]|nr:mechanosensitive ion channel family protein [Bacteroidaceae bacterium]
AHFVALGSLGASSVNITVRVWTIQADYWDVYFDMNQKVYEQLPKRGLNFPYQTYTVNIKQ